MKYVGLLWSNLKRKKIRTALTLLSILVAFLLFGYLAAIRTGLSAGINIAGVDRLVVRHKVSIIQQLPESYELRMEKIDGVLAATPATWFGGVYQDPTNFFAQMPVKPDEFMAMYPEYDVSAEHMNAWRETRSGAIVGSAIAERFEWEVGDRIPIQATIWPRADGGRTWEFDIVGIYDSEEQGADLTQLFFRYDYFRESLPEGARGQVGWYIIRVADPERAAEVSKAIDAEFANSPAETRAETELAFMQGFANQIGNIGKLAVAVLSAVFFTILLVAGNTMGQAVRERIQEIGVLKAVGFTHGQVLGLVLGESVLLSMLGGLVGLLAAYILISAGDPTGGALPVFYFPTPDIVIGLVLTVVLGLVAGLLPGLQALRIGAVDALRRQ